MPRHRPHAEPTRLGRPCQRLRHPLPTWTPPRVWFPDSAHVLDPALLARAFASASAQSGGSILRADVRHMRPQAGNRIEIVTDTAVLSARTAIVCAGAWSTPLLAPFGIHAPLEAERGYHVELSDHAPLVDAPILYADHSVVVTPMASRLRASSYLEFAGLGAPADPHKPTRLRTKLRQLGYQCDTQGSSWMGPRPDPARLPARHRSRPWAARVVLCSGAPTPRPHSGSRDGGFDRRPGGRPHAPVSM